MLLCWTAPTARKRTGRTCSEWWGQQSVSSGRHYPRSETSTLANSKKSQLYYKGSNSPWTSPVSSLPSGTQYWSIRSKTNRLRNSFFPQAVKCSTRFKGEDQMAKPSQAPRDYQSLLPSLLPPFLTLWLLSLPDVCNETSLRFLVHEEARLSTHKYLSLSVPTYTHW